MNHHSTIKLPDSGKCPECGRPLPSDAPRGLCASCLMARALSAEEHSASASPNAAPPSLPRFSNYELLDVIAQGGMGIVYRARDLRLDRTVALKMILGGHLATPAEVERFKIEAEAAAQLEHPNIVPIFDFGEAAGRHFFTMKLVQGGSLAQAIAGRPLAPDRACRLLARVARAVHYAHERGILHRDLKPNNILLDERDEPHLTDFGLAKMTHQEVAAGLTGSLAIMGSAPHMAPEQARGQTRQLTTAADIYSLGAVLYEMLTGRPPFTGATLVETLRRVVEEEPRRPASLNPAVDRDLETIGLKCLEKEPDRRYASAEALALDLERWLRREPVHARPTTLWERARKWSRRKPAHAALVFVLAAAALTLSGERIYHLARLNERVRTLLMEQARAERILNHRQTALDRLAEAARMKRDPILRAEAIQTITQPGVRLAFEAPFGTVATLRFSPDGTLFAAAGDVPYFDVQKATILPVSRVLVWETSSGRRLGEIEWNFKAGPFAFSPDSQILAVPQLDQSIALWAPHTVKISATIPAYGSPLFSPDGSRLAVVSPESVSVHDLAAGKPPRQRSGRAALLAFPTPDTLLLQSRGNDGRQIVRRWNFLDDKEVLLAESDLPPVVSMDGRRLAVMTAQTATATAQLILHDTLTGTELARLPLPDDVSKIQLSPNGSRVAYTSPDEPGRVLVWDVANGRLLTGLGEPGLELASLFGGFRRLGNTLISSHQSKPTVDAPWPSPVNHFSANEAFFAAGTTQGEQNFFLWELSSGARVATLPAASQPVWSLDNRWLAVLHDGQVKLRTNNVSFTQSGRVVVQIWEIAAGTPTCKLPGAIQVLSFNANGSQLAVENTLWDVTKHGDITLLQPVAVAPPMEVIRFAGDKVWSMDGGPFRSSGQMRFRLFPEASTNFFEPVPFALARSHTLTPGGQDLFLACGADRSATNADPAMASAHYQWWNLAQRRRVAVWPHPPVPASLTANEQLAPMVLSRDQHYLASSCYTREGIELWDVAKAQLVDYFHSPPLVSGRKFLGLNIDWLYQHERRRRFVESQVNHIAFTPDNRYILYSARQRVLIREVPGGKLTAYIEDGTNVISGMALSPDGQVLATGADDRKIRLWEVPSGRALAYWEAHESSIGALAFSPDGSILASGSREGTLKLWSLPVIRRELAALGLDW